MRVLTCNIRYAAAPDGENAWPHRRDLCAEVIRAQDPDIICFQEMSQEQYVFLKARMLEYDAHLHVDTPLGQDPKNAIFWRRDRFVLLSAGGYWLSETPHVCGSKSWDSQNIRVAAWVRLVRRHSSAELRVIDTHLDHVGQCAREEQARIINEDASAYPAEYQQILCGDMNADANNPAIRSFLDAGWYDTYAAVHDTLDPGHTFHRFVGPQFRSETGKMDWIFARGKVYATAAEIVRDSPHGRYPSDHYFVSADLFYH